MYRSILSRRVLSGRAHADPVAFSRFWPGYARFERAVIGSRADFIVCISRSRLGKLKIKRNKFMGVMEDLRRTSSFGAHPPQISWVPTSRSPTGLSCGAIIVAAAPQSGWFREGAAYRGEFPPVWRGAVLGA